MRSSMLLIRHAATDPDGRLCGSFDVPLSESGRRQVEALSTRVPRRPPPDLLLTSTLRRAQHVATALARMWHRPPTPVDWAREIHCGEVEGMSIVQLQRCYPGLWVRNEAQTDEAFAWPGGETYAGFRRRVLAGLAETAAANPGRRIAVVTHAGVIAQVLGVLRGRPASVWSRDRPDPLTLTEVTWDSSAPASLVTFNDPDWY